MCRKEFKLLFSHLKRSKKCQVNYDMEMLEKTKKDERKEYDTEKKQEKSNAKRKSDECVFKEEQAIKKRKQRNAKRQVD